MKSQSSLVFPAVFFLILCIAAVYRPGGLANTLSQAAPLIAVAAGVSLVRVLGEYDLSVGSLVTLTAVIFSVLYPTLGYLAAFIVTLCVATICGATTGIVIATRKTPSLLLTFALLWAYQGIAAVLLGGNLGQADIPEHVGGMPVAQTELLVLAGVILLLHFVYRYTPVGWNIDAIAAGASQAVVPALMYFAFVFAVSASLCVWASVCAVTKMSSFSTMLGRGYEVDAIIAVLIGRLFSSDMRISIAGSALGAFTLTSLVNQVDMLGMPLESQYLAKGTLILVAAAFFYPGSPKWFSRMRKVTPSGEPLP